MKFSRIPVLLCFLWLAVSCEKKTAGGNRDGGGLALSEEKEVDVEVVSELGFASRVPADSDFFFAAYYDGEEFMTGVSDRMKDLVVLTEGELELGEEAEEIERKLDEAGEYLGSEMFVFSGPGVGDKLKMVGATYRQFSAAWGGFVVGAALDAFAKEGKELDFKSLGEGLSGDLLERWLSVLEKESKLLVPSVVAGWCPDETRREESKQAVVKMLDEIFKEEKGVLPVSFESYGAEMVGYEVRGTELFGDIIKEGRDDIAEKAEAFDYGGGLSAERLEQLLAALEDVKFTVATGVVDGRVLIYFGDGEEGFQLAGNPEESLAGKDDFKWMAPVAGKRMVAAGYLSEKMVGSVLPWLDTSDFWEALAGAVRAPIVEQRLMRELLSGMGVTSKELAQRDVSAWSGAVYSGDGWAVRTRGGIVNPSIDFDAPWKMADAVGSMNPAFRAHWVQKRDWNDLSWKKIEYFGFIFEAVANELTATFEAELKAVPGGEGTFAGISEAVHNLNKAYREEFRNGIGDEVALFGDFLGEVPPVPGISQETIRDFTVPRFVYARPVVDRAMVTKAGESMIDVWKGMVAQANSVGGGGIPLILPQSIESNDLVTWYPPLPFIGGDFVPGITLNDNVWMVGTSRSLKSGFAKALDKANESVETGVMVEVDFEAMTSWLRDVYEKGKDDAEALAGEEVEAEDIERVKKSADGFFEGLSKLKSLTYRHWLESGKPRTSLEMTMDGE